MIKAKQHRSLCGLLARSIKELKARIEHLERLIPEFERQITTELAKPKPDQKLVAQLRRLVKSMKKELPEQRQHLKNTQAEFDAIC